MKRIWRTDPLGGVARAPQQGGRRGRRGRPSTAAAATVESDDDSTMGRAGTVIHGGSRKRKAAPTFEGGCGPLGGSLPRLRSEKPQSRLLNESPSSSGNFVDDLAKATNISEIESTFRDL